MSAQEDVIYHGIILSVMPILMINVKKISFVLYHDLHFCSLQGRSSFYRLLKRTFIKAHHYFVKETESVGYTTE